MTIHVWDVLWRCGNTVLAMIVLALTLVDAYRGRKRSWSVRERFYWQATVLLFIGVILSSVYAMLAGSPLFPVAGSITTLALVYFGVAALSATAPARGPVPTENEPAETP